jgi:hypothetical protein
MLGWIFDVFCIFYPIDMITSPFVIRYQLALIHFTNLHNIPIFLSALRVKGINRIFEGTSCSNGKCWEKSIIIRKKKEFKSRTTIQENITKSIYDQI